MANVSLRRRRISTPGSFRRFGPRSMTLPANDLEYLGERSTGHQVAAEANMTCVVFPGFQLPPGYDRVQSDLLIRLKSLLVIDWRKKSNARSQLKLSIEDTLDSGLPRAYTPQLYQQKCSAMFEHFYESYPQRDVGIYASQTNAEKSGKEAQLRL